MNIGKTLPSGRTSSALVSAEKPSPKMEKACATRDAKGAGGSMEAISGTGSVEDFVGVREKRTVEVKNSAPERAVNKKELALDAVDDICK